MSVWHYNMQAGGRSVRPCTLRIRVGKEFLGCERYTIEHTRGRFFPNAGGTADNQFIRPGILTMYSGVFSCKNTPESDVQSANRKFIAAQYCRRAKNSVYGILIGIRVLSEKE